MLAHSIRQYISGLFEKIEIGKHVIRLTKQDLGTISKACLDYSMEEIEIQIDPYIFDNFSHLKSLRKKFIPFFLHLKNTIYSIKY